MLLINKRNILKYKNIIPINEGMFHFTIPKYNTNPLQKSLKVASFQLTIPPKCFGVPTALAPIVMESPECQKPIFLDLKERPTEAPFGA